MCGGELEGVWIFRDERLQKLQCGPDERGFLRFVELQGLKAKVLRLSPIAATTPKASEERIAILWRPRPAPEPVVATRHLQRSVAERPHRVARGVDRAVHVLLGVRGRDERGL